MCQTWTSVFNSVLCFSVTHNWEDLRRNQMDTPSFIPYKVKFALSRINYSWKTGMPAQVNNSEKVSGPRNGPVQDSVQLLWYFAAGLLPATQKKNCQDKPRFRAAISNVKGIRWSWRVRSTLQRQTTNQYRDALLDSQLLSLKKIYILMRINCSFTHFHFQWRRY